jgi:hypothetical protein
LRLITVHIRPQLPSIVIVLKHPTDATLASVPSRLMKVDSLAPARPRAAAQLFAAASVSTRCPSPIHDPDSIAQKAAITAESATFGSSPRPQAAATGYGNGAWSVTDSPPTLPEPMDTLVMIARSRAALSRRSNWLDSKAESSPNSSSKSTVVSTRNGTSVSVVPSPGRRAGGADTVATTILLDWSGTTFILRNKPIWVRPLALEREPRWSATMAGYLNSEQPIVGLGRDSGFVKTYLRKGGNVHIKERLR